MHRIFLIKLLSQNKITIEKRRERFYNCNSNFSCAFFNSHLRRSIDIYIYIIQRFEPDLKRRGFIIYVHSILYSLAYLADIIEKVMKPPPLIRPSVSKGAAPPEAINIMRQCWAETAEMRPDFDDVHDLFKKLNHGR